MSIGPVLIGRRCGAGGTRMLVGFWIWRVKSMAEATQDDPHMLQALDQRERLQIKEIVVPDHGDDPCELLRHFVRADRARPEA